MSRIPEPGTPEYANWQQAEFEAEWFAYSFLMPTEHFRNAWKEYGGNLLRLSQLYDVSPTRVHNRARSLSLINEEQS